MIKNKPEEEKLNNKTHTTLHNTTQNYTTLHHTTSHHTTSHPPYNTTLQYSTLHHTHHTTSHNITPTTPHYTTYVPCIASCISNTLQPSCRWTDRTLRTPVRTLIEVRSRLAKVYMYINAHCISEFIHANVRTSRK
jgi:hypothetical protein